MRDISEAGTLSTQSQAEVAQAFKDLERAEQTAAALESHLDSLEKKIDELLEQEQNAEPQLKADLGDTGSFTPKTKSDAENSS